MPRAIASWRVLLVLLCCASIMLAPALAEARAGSSFGGRPSSFGSRGVRSWQYNGAQPLGRAPGPQATAPGFAAPVYGGFVQRHPFLTGLTGGLLGSWLLGHTAGAEGVGGTAGSMIGTLLWLAIIALLLRLGWRMFRARAFSTAWPGARPAGFGFGAAAPNARFRGRDVNLPDADLQAFGRLHAAIQDAWSSGDLGRMRRLMTPEMMSYFSQELMRNTTRGVRNVVSNVALMNGELTEAWEEGDRQYATAFLRWRAIDYMLRMGASPADRNAVVGGDPRNPSQFEEVWTFVRSRGGDWQLSAIQQV